MEDEKVTYVDIDDTDILETIDVLICHLDLLKKKFIRKDTLDTRVVEQVEKIEDIYLQCATVIDRLFGVDNSKTLLE